MNIREAEEAEAKIRSGDWSTMAQLEGMVGSVLDSHDALAALYREEQERRLETVAMCDQLRADLEVAESRKSQAFRDLRGRAEQAEAALREERALYREAVEALARVAPDRCEYGGIEQCPGTPDFLACSFHAAGAVLAKSREVLKEGRDVQP